MSLTHWLTFGALAAAALAASLLVYLRRESLGGRRRIALAALRGAALALLLLLLFDPHLPSPGLAGGRARTAVLLDASLSMELGDEGGRSRWAVASDRAASLAGDGPILLFGDEPRPATREALASARPFAPESRLLPALRAAAEAGASRAVVLTDGALTDASAVSRALPELGLEVDVVRVGAPLPNASLAEVRAPAWAQSGEPVEIGVGVAGSGALPDSFDLVLRAGDQVLARQRVASPAGNRIATAALRFEPAAPAEEGPVRFDIALEPGDAIGADDSRSVYIHVSPQPAGVVLVSLRPDWEPRFLLPVLERALGLPTRGYLRAGDDRYVRLGGGLEAGRPADEDEVRRAVARADLLVLHGAGAADPAWLGDAAGRARRLVVFPAPGQQAPGVPVETPPAVPGDWYILADLPASPVAPLLADAPVDALAPLRSLRPAHPSAGAWTPLSAALGRRGPPQPVFLAAESGPRRWVVPLGEGYWQWALRGSESRVFYQRLWSALGGWLLRDDSPAAVAAVRPVDRAPARGEAVRWIAPGLDAERLALRLTSADGAVVSDTVVPVLGSDSALSPALPPGHYRFEARALRADEELARAEGPLTQQTWSPEFAREAAEPPTQEVAGLAGARTMPRRPLHGMPWAYALVVVILCVEWVLRRRWGLR